MEQMHLWLCPDCGYEIALPDHGYFAHTMETCLRRRLEMAEARAEALEAELAKHGFRFPKKEGQACSG